MNFRFCNYIVYFSLVFSIPVFSSIKGGDALINEGSKEELSRASYFYNEGDFEEASAIYLNLIADNPSYYKAYYNLGVTLAGKGELSRAEEYLHQAKKISRDLNIDDAKVYNALGWVKFKQLEYEEAEENFKYGLNISSNDEQLLKRLYSNLGALYYVLGDLPTAKKYLSIAVNDYKSDGSKDLLEEVNELKKKQLHRVAKQTIELSIEDGNYIGQKVWLNEGGGKLDSLVNWNSGESHASVGIGHFIWYPKDKKGPFKETFPSLLSYFEENNIELPVWLRTEKWCPWNDRGEMLKAKKEKSPRYQDLEDLLAANTPYQVEFMVQRLADALPEMLDSLDNESEKENIKNQFYKISYLEGGVISADGIYALLDYVNFKGEGVKEAERYNNQGWGLLQVLSNMKGDTEQPLLDFSRSAKFVLDRRIKNSPPDRDEERWRNGWNKRIDTYSNDL
ncbi:hypothetical protein AHAT_33760 [Agarivorans sp. Toyoura001]|uniref:tetratricopeptide repeat protein n=1 Tax=Agarivorans sp. Toyoura001 TaxID=2283141 RepID=UPI0010E90AA4|nr:tetratricopeptide repeat protein [Agarivorans sp. Toyoura001]GDY27486.1 hypothetical protein AHAT_33760 [Agarivorans sp. Toyoura001]